MCLSVCWELVQVLPTVNTNAVDPGDVVFILGSSASCLFCHAFRVVSHNSLHTHGQYNPGESEHQSHDLSCDKPEKKPLTPSISSFPHLFPLCCCLFDSSQQGTIRSWFPCFKQWEMLPTEYWHCDLVFAFGEFEAGKVFNVCMSARASARYT